TTAPLPHLHTAVVSFFIKVGSRFETPEDNGLSHFTEHMLFRGTERYPSSLALNTAIEHLGSTLNAETGRDYSLFQLSLEPELVPDAIAVLGELLARPRFDDIELERALILEEINEDYDEAGVEINVDDIARGIVFGDHPLGQRIIGPRSNVERFSLADVRRHHGAYYGARNANLCVAGPVTHHEIVAQAEKSLAQMPSGHRAEVPMAPALHKGPILEHVKDAGSQTALSIVFRAVPELDPRYISLVALLRILDDGMSTRLHYTLADQKGLAYSVHASIEPLADTALFEISSATANAKVPSLIKELFTLLDGLRAGKITDDELAKARTRYRYETLASIDDASSMSGWFGGTALYYEPPSLTQRLEQMAQVRVADLKAIAEQVLTPEHLVIAAVGSLSRARLGELRGVIKDWE
ncbi:MAG TPA: pitrilysin family protein, partial [Kofleriaceae bacterium]